MRLSPNPVLSGVAWLYTWFFRAVPRLVLAILFGNMGILYAHYRIGGVPFAGQLGDLMGVDMDATLFTVDARTLLTGFMAGLLALSLSEAAYMHVPDADHAADRPPAGDACDHPADRQ